ncbi:uncharacterized protein [Littorina saxatilis]|uniref:Ig-like domain-containing protein n=1 Tax=Littorina saxatilis TaxID=31220 RepID=A0AAN9BJA5_9CAEN
MMKRFVFCILIALISCQEPESEEGETTCTAPSVKEGDVGGVTCHFPHDVSTLRPVTLTVELYSPGSTSPSGVLDCSWLSSGTKPCKVQEGYTLNGNVSTTLSLQIAKASETHVGRYACKMMARSENPHFKTCTFQLKENDPLMPGPVIDTRPAPERKTEPVSTTSKATNSSHASSDRQVANSNVVVIAVVVPIVVVIVVVAVVAAVVCYRKRKWCFKKAPTDAEQGPEQKEEEFPLNTPAVSETDSDEDETPESKNKDNTDPNIPESDPVKKAAGSDDHDDDNDNDDDGDDDDDDGDVDVDKRGNTKAWGDPTGENP